MEMPPAAVGRMRARHPCGSFPSPRPNFLRFHSVFMWQTNDVGSEGGRSSQSSRTCFKLPLKVLVLFDSRCRVVVDSVTAVFEVESHRRQK